MDLVKQKYWDESYGEADYKSEISQNHPLLEWIEQVSSLRRRGSSLEIGVYPGGYTNEFGEKGHEINGIDLTPRVNELKSFFFNKNYRVGEFLQEDFFKFKPEKKYDIVFSVGFIEHFTDYKSVIAKHCDLVTDEGVLFIAVPNFKGFIQFFLHKLIDAENLARHNINSMDPEKWINILENNGFDVIRSGYIGAFDFWTGGQKRNCFQIAIRRILIKITPYIAKLLKVPSKKYSPFCGIIAVKKEL